MKGSKANILVSFSLVFVLIFLSFCFFLRVRKINEIKGVVSDFSAIYEVDNCLVLAIIKNESNFFQNAKSNANAVGLMQILPSTFEYVKELLDIDNLNINDQKDNLRAGIYYLKYLTEKFSNLETVIIAYNAGEGVVNDWLNDKRYSVDGLKVDFIPYQETSDYLIKVLYYLEKYKNGGFVF